MCTVLTLFFTIAATLSIVIGLVPADTDNIAANYLGFIMISLDGYTNCLFVMLSFRGFDKWYNRILGCIDSQFAKCWKHKLHEANLSAVQVADMTTTEKETTNEIASTTTTNDIGDK